MLRISPALSIPRDEFRLSFARSSGPGGQNVNKVNSKVTLTWPLSFSPSVPAAIKSRFRLKFANRLNKNGELILTSQRFRNQVQNVADCLDKLRSMLASVEHPPKHRVATRRTKSSKRRRLEAKKHQATRKQLRRGPAHDE